VLDFGAGSHCLDHGIKILKGNLMGLLKGEIVAVK
jgi:hypothetical protein